ncbi:insect cuticle protein domain-containing protein [Phthorimaea operculella]|nr:insect cuticle protein domain-containing protein [Phthorimaea operculella]
MKSNFALSCLLALAAAASAHPPSVGLLPIAHIETISHPSYSFNYAVNDPHTGDNKGQWETRHGDVVKGAYSLVEPDGNVRIVEYTADPIHGFNAVVKRSGPNVHSVGLPAHAPVIAKPILAPAPIIDHGPLLAPLIDHGPIFDHGPILAPLPAWDHLPLPLHLGGPLVHVSGTTYSHGHPVHKWAAGPISLDGKTLTIRDKYHH